MSEEQQKQKINVEIDTRRTEELSRENERLRIKAEELEEKLRLSAEAHIKKKMQELGLPLDRLPEFMNNPEALKEYTPRQTPSGSAPMNSRQMGIQEDSLYKRRFQNTPEGQKLMVDSILDQMHFGKTQQERDEATSYYNAMLMQWIRSKKQKQDLDEFYNPNLPQNIPDLKTVEGGYQVPRNADEGDVGKIFAKFRAERLQKIGVIKSGGEQ